MSELVTIKIILVMTSGIGVKIDGSTDLSSPFEDEGELGEMPNFATGLFLGVDRLELGLRAGELDLAFEGFIELDQLFKMVASGTETLGFFDSGSDLGQLFAFSKDDLFCFVIEKANKGSSPLFVDGEVELEFLLWSTIGVSKDSYICLEDPG